MLSKTLAALAAATLLGTAANAVTYTIDFNDLTAPGFTGSFSVLPTSVGGIAAAPNSTPFLVVPSDGASASGTATFTSTNRITAFSFDWGTPDDYNTLTFRNGATVVASFTGAGLGAGNYAYTFTDAQNVTSVDFTSSNRAFEIDNVGVTAVPEPATWALLLVGFGMVGVAARRRSTSVAA
ncbi:Npun_F0296 family exosortase-dependent surface protein [Glacieibacterium frigidum]|uniref:PEP-CTERM sorting domain-containing protein n=1 Tax=Glacieibacterium frigidum TaxID=2593303 RepID=A0A552UIT4_9SPHN|nr:PEPxxWA-CTERM sorting domain-containing protein [Glacieibacterium frigidum]TRW18128.1 PEP-CTERM sorting domain-containing protein [Glacieibacterium frigidum]